MEKFYEDILSIENQKERENPYKNSTLLDKVQESKKIAFVDIDSTITSSDPEKQLKARQKFETDGYAVVFVTARTYEMQISDQERQIVIGDQAFPNTKAPETIIAYLDSQSNTL